MSDVKVTLYNEDNRVVQEFWQWDKSQSICVEGLPVSPAPVFQFTSPCRIETINVVPEISDGKMTAAVPDLLLETDGTITAYIYRRSQNGARRTLEAITIPVRERVRPAQ